MWHASCFRHSIVCYGFFMDRTHRSWRVFFTWLQYIPEFGLNGSSVTDFGIYPFLLFVRCLQQSTTSSTTPSITGEKRNVSCYYVSQPHLPIIHQPVSPHPHRDPPTYPTDPTTHPPTMSYSSSYYSTSNAGEFLVYILVQQYKSIKWPPFSFEVPTMVPGTRYATATPIPALYSYCCYY